MLEGIFSFENCRMMILKSSAATKVDKVANCTWVGLLGEEDHKSHTSDEVGNLLVSSVYQCNH